MTVPVRDMSGPDEAQAHLAAIIESSADAIISKTLKGIILTWNSGAEHVYGYTAAEAIGQPLTLLLPEERTDEELDILARISRGERVDHFETTRRRKDGSLIEVSLTISPILSRDGVIIGASHVARNISDRRRIEDRLQRLAAIVDSSEDAIISKTLQGVILTWNGGAQHLWLPGGRGDR